MNCEAAVAGSLVNLVVGGYAKAVRMTVVVRDKELGLSIVSILDRRGRKAQPQKAFPECMNVAGRPVQRKPLVVVRLDRRGACALVEPEVQSLVMNHAPDKTPILAHGAIHRQAQAIHPETKALLQVGARNDGNAGLNEHDGRRAVARMKPSRVAASA
jgi:hypothetical protein